ncbi:MAG: type II toxin-antitoxin system HicA family toxin [Candidatus Aenigmarchaeota archaeon]|nr:type II toxin-antitoxin system HicA family toxin [Candidatus Aenigmarchaeota archaeon]
MSRLPTVSGKEMIKFLCNKRGFRLDRQRGSHAIVKGMIGGKEVAIPVPLYDEISIGVRKDIIACAGMSEEEFIREFRR